MVESAVLSGIPTRSKGSKPSWRDWFMSNYAKNIRRTVPDYGDQRKPAESTGFKSSGFGVHGKTVTSVESATFQCGTITVGTEQLQLRDGERASSATVRWPNQFVGATSTPTSLRN
jgi:hypothetical protein